MIRKTSINCINLYTHEIGRIERINQRRTKHSYLADSPTPAVINYSTFKFCYVEIHPGKGEMKNNLTHIYFYNALKEVFLIFQVKGWVREVLEFPTLLPFWGGGSYICLQLVDRTFIL